MPASGKGDNLCFVCSPAMCAIQRYQTQLVSMAGSISSLFRKVSLLIEKSLMNFCCMGKKKTTNPMITFYYQCAHLKNSLHLCIVFSCKYIFQNVLAKNTILWFMVHVVSERNNCITNQWKQSKCSSWACTIKNWIKTIQAQKCKYAMFPISKKIKK